MLHILEKKLEKFSRDLFKLFYSNRIILLLNTFVRIFFKLLLKNLNTPLNSIPPNFHRIAINPNFYRNLVSQDKKNPNPTRNLRTIVARDASANFLGDADPRRIRKRRKRGRKRERRRASERERERGQRAREREERGGGGRNVLQYNGARR